MPRVNIRKLLDEGISPAQVNKLRSIAFKAEGGDAKALSFIQEHFSDSVELDVPNKPSIGQRILGFVSEIGPEAAGATAGAIAGAPFAVPTGGGSVIGGAALGAAGGEALQQVLGRFLPSTAPPSGLPQSSTESISRLSDAATFGILQEAGPLARGAALGAARPAVEASTRFGALQARGANVAAQEAGISLTPAQASQSSALTATESISRRGLVAASIYKKFDTKVNRQLIGRAEDILDNVSKGRLSREEAGANIQLALKDAKTAASEAIGAVRDGISSQAGDVPLNSRAVSARAQQLLSEFEGSRVSEAASVEGLGKAREILSKFAEPGGPVTVQDALKDIKLINKLIGGDELTIAQGELGQLKNVLMENIDSALRASGNPKLASQLRSSNLAFAQTLEKLEQGTIKRVLRSDRPELVGGIILDGGITTAKNVTSLIASTGKTRQLAQVQRSVLEEIVSRAVKGDVTGVSEGVLPGQSLLKVRERVGDDVLQEIFKTNPGILSEFDRFTNLANTIALKSNVSLPTSATSPTLLALGQSGALGALVFGGQITLPNVGLVLAPEAISVLFTNKASLRLLNRALITPASSKFGKRLTQQILTIIEADRQARSNRERFGATIQERIESPIFKP